MSLVFGDAFAVQRDTFSGNDFPISAGDGVSISGHDLSDFVVLPGFVDVHVHLREPGFSYKETIRTGTLAAARGGYTTVCAMPNLNPVPDSAAHLQAQLDLIRAGAAIRVLPYGAITVGQQGAELAALEELAPYVVAFSDDGRGVQNDDMMRRAMRKAKELGKLIVAHCEDNSLLRGGYIHDGAYARAHGHRGICSESEWRQIQRDLALVRETGCGYHVCHISTKESVDLIRRAKAEGLDVTCETAPHYLLLDDAMLEEDGRFKMNPPLRDKSDREALLAGLADGTIDMIATDHAPHSAEEKARSLTRAPSGMIGLETSLGLVITNLVATGKISWERMTELMGANQRAILGVERVALEAGSTADLTVIDPEAAWTVDAADFCSKAKNSGFIGAQLTGRATDVYVGGYATMEDGKIVE